MAMMLPDDPAVVGALMAFDAFLEERSDPVRVELALHRAFQAAGGW